MVRFQCQALTDKLTAESVGGLFPRATNFSDSPGRCESRRLLNLPGLPSVGQRRQPGVFLERPGEVTLVVEAAGLRDCADRVIRFGQLPPG